MGLYEARLQEFKVVKSSHNLKFGRSSQEIDRKRLKIVKIHHLKYGEYS